MMTRSMHIAAGLSLLVVMSGAGCSSQDRNDSTDEFIGQEELQAFREEVTGALDEIQAEISQLQESVEPQVEESWSSLTSNTQSATAELMADLDRLSTASAEEARAIQRAAAERLAELEAGVKRTEISSATTADSLAATASMQLMALESDIREIVEEVANEPTAVPEVGSMRVEDDDPLVLQERLTDIRSGLTAVTNEAAEEAFVESREQISSDIAQLTADVRKKWYEQMWGLDG